MPLLDMSAAMRQLWDFGWEASIASSGAPLSPSTSGPSSLSHASMWLDPGHPTSNGEERQASVTRTPAPTRIPIEEEKVQKEIERNRMIKGKGTGKQSKGTEESKSKGKGTDTSGGKDKGKVKGNGKGNHDLGWGLRYINIEYRRSNPYIQELED